MALVLADLDRFKLVNDHLGHAEGDAVLRRVADQLRVQRRVDAAFRIGGDEFAMLLAETNDEGARIVVDRIHALLAELGGKGNLTVEGLTASFCFALCPPDAEDAQTLFRLADEALYEAKRAGEGLLVVAGA